MKNLCENSINNKKVEIAAFDDFIDTNFNKIKGKKIIYLCGFKYTVQKP